jgi:hypothetical protein
MWAGRINADDVDALLQGEDLTRQHLAEQQKMVRLPRRCPSPREETCA